MPLMMAVVVEDGIDIGALVTESVADARMVHKECYLSADYTKGDWANALKGQRSLDLWKLRQLPLKFWLIFLPKLGAAVLHQHLVDLQLPYRMVRASIPDANNEKRSA